ncbi:MAG: hypothetical protein ACYCZJ_11790 [Sulfuriferula sp.]
MANTQAVTDRIRKREAKTRILPDRDSEQLGRAVIQQSTAPVCVICMPPYILLQIPLIAVLSRMPCDLCVALAKVAQHNGENNQIYYASI